MSEMEIYEGGGENNEEIDTASIDYYGLLNIQRDATQDEVKRAYRRLARKLHPDVNPDVETWERFKDISQAYSVLSDPDKRRMYDQGEETLYPQGSNVPQERDAFLQWAGIDLDALDHDIADKLRKLDLTTIMKNLAEQQAQYRENLSESLYGNQTEATAEPSTQKSFLKFWPRRRKDQVPQTTQSDEGHVIPGMKKVRTSYGYTLVPVESQGKSHPWSRTSRAQRHVQDRVRNLEKRSPADNSNQK